MLSSVLPQRSSGILENNLARGPRILAREPNPACHVSGAHPDRPLIRGGCLWTEILHFPTRKPAIAGSPPHFPSGKHSPNPSVPARWFPSWSLGTRGVRSDGFGECLPRPATCQRGLQPGLARSVPHSRDTRRLAACPGFATKIRWIGSQWTNFYHQTLLTLYTRILYYCSGTGRSPCLDEPGTCEGESTSLPFCARVNRDSPRAR